MRVYDKYIEYKKIIYILFLFLILTIITFFVKNYFSPLLIIVILLVFIRPIYNLVLKTKIDKRISGALSILILNVIIFCFIFYFGNSIHKNILYIYENHFNDIVKVIDDITVLIGVNLKGIFGGFGRVLNADMLKTGASITGSSILSYAIANITVYFLLVDSKLFYKFLLMIFPYDLIEKMASKKNNLKEVIKVELRLVIISTIIIIIGFEVLRIPSSVFLGILCGMLDILPYVGTIIVFIPIIIYNIVVNNYLVVIGLIALYILSQVIREILELKFLSSKLDVHPLVVMLSIYIGAEIFGLIGIITGPIFCILAKDIIYN